MLSWSRIGSQVSPFQNFLMKCCAPRSPLFHFLGRSASRTIQLYSAIGTPILWNLIKIKSKLRPIACPTKSYSNRLNGLLGNLFCRVSFVLSSSPKSDCLHNPKIISPFSMISRRSSSKSFRFRNPRNFVTDHGFSPPPHFLSRSPSKPICSAECWLTAKFH